ncbi:acyl-CoA dehydrogenase family protein [Nonomuraea monospora]|uniref:Acyl-CoA dehydrogenase family protein n=1 Tax=Nonomuraea monospora TaxID=568818 RepID=A0ABP5PNK9_9ACTN
MLKLPTPSGAELVARAADLARALRGRTARAERDSAPNSKTPPPKSPHPETLHPEILDAMTLAGVYRLCVPARFGGYAADAGTVAAVAAELAGADGAASWAAAASWSAAWACAMFPGQAQEDVFSGGDVRMSGTLRPTAMAFETGEGIEVNGRWGQIAGAAHSQWQLIAAMRVGADGRPTHVLALARTSDLKLVDGWDAPGLRGCGGAGIVADHLFVPAHRVLPLRDALRGSASHAPLVPFASVCAAGAALGLARAAREAFAERVTYGRLADTDYESRAAAPTTHLRVADATMKIDEAEFHTRRLAGLLDGKAARGEDWSLAERARARAEAGEVCRLGRLAADTLAAAGDETSVRDDEPLHRIARDLGTLSLHSLTHPATGAELYGRTLCGLPPHTLYV